MKHTKIKLSALIFAIILSLGVWSGSCSRESHSLARGKTIPDKISFNFHVKPILSDRCFKCHGPDENTREAGLRLDTKEGAFAALGKAKDHYAIIPGDVENSTLVQRIFSDDPEEVMPSLESNLTLDEYEKQILKKWIQQGAEWQQHWSFTPPKQSDIPEVVQKDWPKNEIDYFILSRLEKENIKPSPEADKERLIRRLSFDLTGLPPTLELIDAFLADSSEMAYENAVDQLLSTPAYAERMAASWLDLARYADTHGYQDDLERVMWPWRDWVIHAYRKNMPFDQFVKWQLAGDLLPDPTREQIIATAFNRNHKITQEGGVIPEEFRVEYVADRTQTFATAFLGLTMECARCHDHKYDPISQKDYYQLFGFFNNVPEKGLIETYGAIPEPYIFLTKEEIDQTLHFVNNLDTLEKIPLMVMEEMPEPRQAYILTRGQYDQHGDPVDPNTPSSLGPLPENLPANRLGLAEWLFQKDHPLMSRVTVNRFWQQLFGNGIVTTTEDFGAQGALPTHPELLDFLAIKFMEDGWDVKAMLKYIVCSATYRQSLKRRPELVEIDPENSLLARGPRLRLTAEMIRDQALAISGLLVEEIGGPSVKPYQPAGLWAETTGGGGGSTAKYEPDTGQDLYRRSIYTFWKRTVPPPSMMTYDAASRDFCVVRRQRTSTPLQALVQMNDPQIVEAARVLAYRAIKQAEADPISRLAYMFRLATSRQPEMDELATLKDYFQAEKEHYNLDVKSAAEFLKVGQAPQEDLLPIPEMAAYALVANAIFNLDETITKN